MRQPTNKMTRCAKSKIDTEMVNRKKIKILLTFNN